MGTRVTSKKIVWMLLIMFGMFLSIVSCNAAPVNVPQNHINKNSEDDTEINKADLSGLHINFSDKFRREELSGQASYKVWAT